MNIFKELTREHNTIEITAKLFSLLNLNVTKTTLAEELNNHPNYPSFLCISDILTSHGVDNITVKLSIEQLGQMPMPCIVPIKIKDHEEKFAIIEFATDKIVRYFNPVLLQSENIPTEDFGKIWIRGILMLVDVENAREEHDYKRKRQDEKRAALSKYTIYGALPLLVLVTGVTTLIERGSAALGPVFYAFSTLVGLVTSFLLLWYEIDEHNPGLQQICKAGKKVSCSAILSSGASKMFGISWSTIGFVYFFGGLTLMLTQGLLNSFSLFFLGLFSVIALTYIPFSIYYQWKVARQWCVLCLTVQGILLLQGGTVLMTDWITVMPVTDILKMDFLWPLSTSYFLPMIAIIIGMPAFRLSKVSKQQKIELQRFKHNPQIFETLLAKQKVISESTENLGIMLGNSNAIHKIIKVCNPYCGPCAKAHTPMEELLINNPQVQIQIIFTATNDDGDRTAAPVRHLMAIQEMHGEKIMKQALDDWYLAPQKDYDIFANKYPMNGEPAKQGEKIKAMKQWCENTNITFTPTFFVNGYQLPEMYTVNDLKYFLSV